MSILSSQSSRNRNASPARVAFAIAATLAAGAGARAQEAPKSGAQLEEITVTARKQAERLQDAPISITAFTAEALERRDAIEIVDAVESVPNMQFDVGSSFSGSSAFASVYIRGIGQNEPQLSVDPGVGLYVDGVYMSRVVGQTLDLVDVERLEVLRGPQGTLFGRNTIGGAVNLITKRPGREPGGSVTLQTGSDWDTIARVSVDGPLSDRVRAGATVLYHYRDNYIKGVSGGESTGKRNALSGRVVMDVDVTDDLLMSVAVDATRSREPGMIGVPVAYYDTSAFGGAHNAFFSGAPQVCVDFASTARFSDPRCYNAQWLKGQFSYAGTYETPESHQTVFEAVHNHRFERRHDLDLWGGSLQLDWHASDSLQFKSISAFRSAQLDLAHDGDHSPHLIVHTDDIYNIKHFTQEFQLIGNNLDNRLNWILGAYYFYEDGKMLEIVDTNLVMFRSGAVIETNSYALFGQATFDVTDRVSVTGGLRWTDESKTFSAGDRFTILADFGIGIPAGFPILPTGQVMKAKGNKVTPLASVNFKATEDLNLYVSFSQGFKGGGFTQTVFPSAPAIPTFQPEKLTSYEAGIKFLGFDRRLRANGAIFYGDYRDIQVTVLEGVAPTIRNAAKGRVKGAELELQAAVSAGLLLEAGLGYLDAEYTEVSGAAALAGLNEDKKFVNAPKWTLSAAATYEFDIGVGTLSPRVDWSYRTRTYNNAVNTPEISQPGFHLFNASLSFDSPDRLWRVAAGVKNIGDKNYLMSGYADPSGIGAAEAVFDRGRTVFVSARRSF
ncbi:MAG: TonB-dependent receptor [Dehalococcoidia bacterium]